jgi:putative glutamine amidotransferase
MDDKGDAGDGRVTPGTRGERPTIVLTVAAKEGHPRPDLVARRNALYAAAIERHGGQPLLLHGELPPAAHDEGFSAMDGLLLTGGPDIRPARYGQRAAGAVIADIDDRRDALEERAWRLAEDRELPVLGICRGLQAINVFSGGTLVQHVDGHAGPSWGDGRPAATHPLRLVDGTRLRAVLGADELVVNSYHHQGVDAGGLAPTLRPAAVADGVAGELIEAIEALDGRFVIGVQCHPERTESTPAAFERLFAAFVAAARQRSLTS